MIYNNLYLLGLLPLIIFFLLKFKKWEKSKKLTFAEAQFHPIIFEKKSVFSKIFPLLYCLAFLFLILAMLDFSIQKQDKIEVNQKSSNILFLVDVSNSMNAEDVEPSRLEQAINILSQTLSSLHEERVGIVIFAGEAQSIMPITTDYSSAHLFLNSINSELIQTQGTDFLLAVKESIKKLNQASLETKKIILISDGEDHEGHHHEAIREAKNNNIIITTVGIGTEKGAPIPELKLNYYPNYKRDEYGQVILTKRETSALKSIAQETGGQYIDGNNPQNATKKIIENIHQTSTKNQSSTITTLHYTRYYQWFLGIAILLFLAIYFLNPKKDFNF